MTLGRFLANAALSGLLIPAAAMLAILEIGTVDGTRCDRETFEYICSDYEGLYGAVSAVLLLIWAILTWALNRTREDSD